MPVLACRLLCLPPNGVVGLETGASEEGMWVEMSAMDVGQVFAAAGATVNDSAPATAALSRLLTLESSLPGTVRAVILVVLCAGLVALGCMLTLRPVFDPNRAVVYRLATLNRIAGPGYIFVLPLLENVESVLDMGERETRVKLADARSCDGAMLAPAFEVTWRISPGVRGRVAPRVRATVLMPEERRAKLVDEVVSRCGRLVLSEYSRAELALAEARESAARTIALDANDALAARGILVERVFWRG